MARSPTTTQRAERRLLEDRDIALVRAPNPGVLTLSGTNTWVLGREPAWVVDPGPLIASHLRALAGVIERRGGLGGVALTHGHADHAEAVEALLGLHRAPVAAASEQADMPLRDGARIGPFLALAAPGHAEDHFVLIAADACFSGDAVLGEGSVFVSPYRGAMSAYLGALERLSARHDFTIICPGHGPVIADGHAKLAEYRTHRLQRESDLLAALQAGLRTLQELLDEVWSDAPAPLRPAAAATLEAHLDKLEHEGRLPEGVERLPGEWLDAARGAAI